MSLRLAVLKNVFDAYSTKACSLLFLFLAMIYFIIKDKKEQRNLLIYEIFGILLLVTPFIGNKIVTLLAGEGSNWPVYGILCVIPVTAYVAVDIWKELSSAKERKRFLLLFFVVVQLGLGISLTGEMFLLPKNWEKTSALTLRIEALLDDTASWRVMAPERIAGELRICRDDIRVFYSEDYKAIQQEEKRLQTEALVHDCNCIILEIAYDKEEELLACGYSRLAETDGYVIYTKK